MNPDNDTKHPEGVPRYSGEWVECAKERPTSCEHYRVVHRDGSRKSVFFDGAHWRDFLDSLITHWYREYPQAPLPSKAEAAFNSWLAKWAHTHGGEMPTHEQQTAVWQYIKLCDEGEKLT